MRPDVDRYFTDMARLVASRSTCVRRHVGCVLVDDRNRVLATGYNGVASGVDHCNEVDRQLQWLEGAPQTGVFSHACPGADAGTGERLEGCRAVHAEQNAILQCADSSRVAKAYVTAFPCESCAKLLLNTKCREIVYLEPYGDRSCVDEWVRAGRLATRFDGEPPMIQRDIVLLYGRDEPLNAWRVCVACVCLNLCSARVARGVIMRILDRWPDPASLGNAGGDLDRLLGPLGLAERRAMYLRDIGRRWDEVPVAELSGVGPYALESVAVFCRGERPESIGDRKVAAWVAWREDRSLPLL